MGRKKPAPQPLTLQASATSPTAAVRSGDNSSSTGPENMASAATSLSAADSSRSPVSATVPRSSPFTSKFSSQNRRPQTARPGGESSSSHSFADQQQPQQQQPQQQQQQQQQLSAQFETTTVSTRYEPVPASSSQPDASRPRTGRFHFSKPSKTSNQLTGHSHKQSEPLVPLRAQIQGNPNQIDAAPTPVKSSNPLRLRSSRSELSLLSTGDRESNNTSLAPLSRKNKPKSFGLLARNKSVRDREISSPTELRDPMPGLAPQPTALQPMKDASSPALKTASAANERSFRDMMDSSSQRNKSEDRAPKNANNADSTNSREGTSSSSRENSSNRHQHHHHHRDKDARENKTPNLPPVSRENGSFLSGLRSSSTKAAGMIGSRFFGRGLRSAHASDRESLDDEHYVIKVLNLPLAEQARKTRISKRLEDSRDKTEFWMPSFPWRAIDYLNYKGCEIEGLYRVPGSGPQIKKWQRRFDEGEMSLLGALGPADSGAWSVQQLTRIHLLADLDVDLFEQDDLYDINIIGSMLKAWLRELPDELFPKAAQERISRECAGSEEVPQMLIDELSNLSPFQYYLLFAITCHLSLLLAHSDKNKMDFRNLCICFQPCMKIDVFCFKFLVCDWRDCWKGCKNESAFIEEEYALLDQPPPPGLGLAAVQEPTFNEQKPPEQRQQQRPPKTPPSDGDDDAESSVSSKNSTSSDRSTGASAWKTPKTQASLNSDREITTTPKLTKTAALRRLSPIEPLSPLGF
ncbi:RhoGAP [Geosmithia morbida]|uniref:RhoGAP n=1 Tax=Geosmithia morbida TaxID=1094350 RepID=A0A9P5D6V1_9HYPO|nr:RhoGAP [Geosmithia morbida]KAF4123889.1 RhoGAP [Geosmithia morbida]